MRSWRALATVLALCVAATGCGGGHSKSTASHDAVTLYITHVNDVQQHLRNPLNAVARTMHGFSHTKDIRKTTPGLIRAEQTLKQVHVRLAAVDPPPAARKLQRLLLQLVAREVALSNEVRLMSTFTPALVQTLQPLNAADKTASRRLGAARQPAKVSAALDAYRASIHGVLARLRSLNAPDVLQPLLDAQTTRLVLLARSLARLSTAVRSRTAAAIPALQHAVSVASVSSDSRAAQLAQQTAVRTYDDRVRAVNALVGRISAERNRLQANR